MGTLDRDERILILAPLGRDGELARHTVTSAGMTAEICTDVDDLFRKLAQGAGALLLTQEALSRESTGRLLAALDTHDPWSDLPVVVLVSRESRASVHFAEQLGTRANATFLERPVGGATLVRAVEMAVRARRRQYELRDQLLALDHAREAERQARALAEEAVRIRDEFLATVAHDLRNPLGAIKGFAQLIQRQVERRGLPDPATLVQQLGRIEGTATRALGQIDELLDSARLRAGQPLTLALAPVDLLPLVQRVVAEWQEMSPDHHIHVEAPTDSILGTWDERRVERAVSNLVGNAVKYSPEGGDVAVRIEQDGDAVTLTVEDRGIGIPREDLPYVFEQFYRASNATGFPGTGLGLAGVRQIIEQHGGTIAVESVEGQGTQVRVRLPATAHVGPDERVGAAG